MVADQPLDDVTLATAVGYPPAEVATALRALAAEYAEQGRGFELRNVAGGWRYYTREEYAPVVERFVLDGQQARLTQAALETLAVVAYRQPVSRARVSAIRGVNVDGVMRTLVTRGLVEEAGHDARDRRRTSTAPPSYFLERIGVTSLDELPELAPFLPEMDDFDDDESRRGHAHRRVEPQARAGRRTEPEAGRDRRRRPDPAAEAARPVGGRQPPQVRGADARRAGRGRRRGRHPARHQGRPDAPRSIRVDGQRLPPVSDARLPRAQQAARRRLDDVGPRGPAGRSATSSPTGPSGSSTSAGSTPTPTGLILLTNDGDFAQRLAHPSYEVDKTYVAEVEGVVRTADGPAAARRASTLEDGPVDGRARRKVVSQPRRTGRSSSWCIHEGRNRIVRRLLDHVGHPVRRLTRTAIGPVRLAGLEARRACAS